MKSRAYNITLLAVVGLVFGNLGCGQSISIRVTRLGQVSTSENNPVTIARTQVRQVAVKLAGRLSQALRYKDVYEQYAFKTDLLAQAGYYLDTTKHVAQRMKQPLSIRIVAVYADELKDILAWVRDNEQSLAELSQALTEDRALDVKGGKEQVQKAREALTELANSTRQLNKIIALAEELIIRATRRSHGGFVDNTVFKVDAASPAYDEIFGAKKKPKEVVFAEIEVEAIGESGVLVIQETPAQFVLRAISADPTEVLRNALIVISKILQVVNSFVPALVGVGLPDIGGMAAPGGVPAAGRDIAGEGGTDGMSVADIGRANAEHMLASTEFQTLVLKARRGETLTADEEATLIGMLKASLPFPDSDD